MPWQNEIIVTLLQLKIGYGGEVADIESAYYNIYLVILAMCTLEINTLRRMS